MNNTVWKAARERAADAWAQEHGESAPAGFRNIRVHDLKHTFDRKLRASASAFFGLSKLSVWWLRLGIGIERIKPATRELNIEAIIRRGRRRPTARTRRARS